MHESERRASVDGAQEAVLLKFCDRRFQLRLERLRCVVIVVVVQLYFTETGRGRLTKRLIDGGARLLAGIKKCVLRRTADTVAVSRSKRRVATHPVVDTSLIVVRLEVVGEQHEDVGRSGCSSACGQLGGDGMHVVRQKDIVLTGVHPNTERQRIEPNTNEQQQPNPRPSTATPDGYVRER